MLPWRQPHQLEVFWKVYRTKKSSIKATPPVTWTTSTLYSSEHYGHSYTDKKLHFIVGFANPV